MASGALITYLGTGIAASRPVTPDTFTGIPSLYYATDTDTLSVWDGSTWEDVGGGGGGAAPVVPEAGSSRAMDPSDAGTYVRFTGTGAKTATFDDGDGFSADQEYHIANRASSGNLTLTAAGTMTLNPPKGGTLVLEPGDTVTVKMVASDEADVFGSTEAAP